MQPYFYPFFLVVVAFLGAPAVLSAQCTPLDSIPGDAIIDPLPFTDDMPENGIRDTACVGEDFVTVFNIEVPDTVEIPPFGSLAIDSITVEEDAVAGLPGGLDVTFNPVDRTFLPNTTGCIQIAGVPDAGTENTYDLTISVRIYSGFFNSEFTLPDGNLVEGEYTLFVRENGNPACNPVSVTEAARPGFSLSVYPNPATDRLIANIELAESEDVTAILFDAMGRRVRTEKMPAAAGLNQLHLPVGDLPNGYYTLLVGPAAAPFRSGVTRRVFVQH